MTGVFYALVKTPILATAAPATLFITAMAFLCLLADHVWTPIPVPWGHAFWHVLAAIAFDALIQDGEASALPIQ